MARKKKFELNDNNLAIAYYRFSSHSQNEASIDQQRELAHAWADAQCAQCGRYFISQFRFPLPLRGATLT